MHHVVIKLLANDVPGLLFFTTYTLLVLFWAEIYHQAKSQSTTKLRPTFLGANIAVYAIQARPCTACAMVPWPDVSPRLELSRHQPRRLVGARLEHIRWHAHKSGGLFQLITSPDSRRSASPQRQAGWTPVRTQISLLLLSGVPSVAGFARDASAWFLVAAATAAAAGFILYGGRLFAMLRRFPIESRGRKKKLREVRPLPRSPAPSRHRRPMSPPHSLICAPFTGVSSRSGWHKSTSTGEAGWWRDSRRGCKRWRKLAKSLTCSLASPPARSLHAGPMNYRAQQALAGEIRQ